MRNQKYIAIPPGATINEQIKYLYMSQKEFSSRMEMSEEFITHLIDGNVPITQEIAYKLEMVLGLPANFWNNLEAIYREKIEKIEVEKSMSEFIKPKTVFVSDTEYIQNLVNANLKKDLHDNEEICQHCHGTGMVIVNNSYGLSNDPNKMGGYFPYRHQSISFCPNCYNGVVHRCPHCGKLIKKGWLKCYCEAQQKIERQEEAKKQQEELDNAPIAPKEIVDATECFFSESYSNNEGYFFDWDEFFEDWFENHESDEERPLYVWITEPVEMSVDVQNIIESATDNLYEDAFDDITSEARKELQEFVDGWCKRCGVGTTYYESHKYKVKIPWEEY